jgi:hypothetical protein
MGRWLVDILILQTLYDTVCYRLGFIFCKACTLGRYPGNAHKTFTAEALKLLGVFILLVLTILAASLL